MSSIEPQSPVGPSTPRTPAAWIFLALTAATALSAAISMSMIAAPQMLTGEPNAGLVPLFLAIGAVYLGIPVTWLLGVSVIATYPRQNVSVINRSSGIAVAIWTVALAIPYVTAIAR